MIVVSLLTSLILCFVLETTVGLKVDIRGYLDIEENDRMYQTLNIAVTVYTNNQCMVMAFS